MPAAASPPAKVVVLASGGGTLLQALLDDRASSRASPAGRSPRSGPTVAVAPHWTGPTDAGVPTFSVPLADHADRDGWNAALADRCADADLIVLAGFMKLLGPPFLTRHDGKVINSHPSLLPSFPGMHAPRDALDVRRHRHGLFDLPGRRRCRRRPDRRAAGGAGAAGRHGGRPARTDQGRRTRAAGRGGDGDDDARLAGFGTKGDARMTDLIAVRTGRRSTRQPVERALISVSDKTGLLELAAGLHDAGVAIVSTGSTARTIADQRHSGHPGRAGHRLRRGPRRPGEDAASVHPRRAARRPPSGRSRRSNSTELGIEPFDLVVVNLYPFARTVAAGAGYDDVVEQIDIGGPAMVRASAKNHASVAVVVDPAGYDAVLAAVRDGGFTLAQRQRLAADAYRHTAGYDVQVATWLGATDRRGCRGRGRVRGDGLPDWIGATWTSRRCCATARTRTSRPRSTATTPPPTPAWSAPSNCTARRCPTTTTSTPTPPGGPPTTRPSRRSRSSNTPTRAASRSESTSPRRTARHTPATRCPRSAASSRSTARSPSSWRDQIADIFTEVVVAPRYDDGAVEVLTRKKNVRLLRVTGVPAGSPRDASDQRRAAGAGGGPDRRRRRRPGGLDAGRRRRRRAVRTLADLAFAWRACRAVKSNAILLADDGASVGIGMGQVNRVDSARLAVQRAGERAAGAVAASDAFFPFPDGLEVLLAAVSVRSSSPAARCATPRSSPPLRRPAPPCT